MPALRALSSSSGGASCPGTPGVNLRGRPRGSGGDSKVIKAKKKFCDGRTDGWTDRRDSRNSDVDVTFLVVLEAERLFSLVCIHKILKQII